MRKILRLKKEGRLLYNCKNYRKVHCLFFKSYIYKFCLQHITFSSFCAFRRSWPMCLKLLTRIVKDMYICVSAVIMVWYSKSHIILLILSLLVTFLILKTGNERQIILEHNNILFQTLNLFKKLNINRTWFERYWCRIELFYSIQK